MTRNTLLSILLVSLGVAAFGCTFERRSDAVDIEEEPTPGELAATDSALMPTVGPGATVRLFRDSVTAGDLSLALSILHGDATLVDVLAGQASAASTRGELLLELRQWHAAGNQFEVMESEAQIVADSAALVVSRLAILEEGAGGIGEEVGRLNETAFLIREGEGWRIRHLHRSPVSSAGTTPTPALD